MRRPRIRFWQKGLAALVIVGVAPIALVSVVSTNNTRNDLTLLGVTNIRQRSTSTANAIDAYLASRLGDIILVAKLPDIVRYATNLGDPESRAAARRGPPAAPRRMPGRRGSLARVRIRRRRGPEGHHRRGFRSDRRRHQCRLPGVLPHRD